MSKPLDGLNGAGPAFLKNSPEGVKDPATGLDLRQFFIQSRPWTSVQDGHTYAEQILYQAMYTRGKPIDPHTKSLLIGVRTLAKLVPMSYSRCQINLKSLVEKLAIEERPAEKHTDGRLILIYTYDEILRRRRSSGLTHVFKRTSRVILLNPGAPDLSSGAPRYGAPVLSSGAPRYGAPVLSSGAPRYGAPDLSSGAPYLCSSGAPYLGASLLIEEFNSRKGGTLSSSTSSLVAAAFLEVTGHSDDDAVRRLMECCRSKAPDATDEEIAYFLRHQAERFARNRNVTNLVGLLLTQVPKCFEGESFKLYRQAEKQRQEAATQRQLAFQAEWRRTLEDPKSSQEDKRMAREFLEEKE